MTPPLSPSAPEARAFRYGWRYRKVPQPDGSVSLEQIPLTLEDVLHPQENDVIPVNKQHAAECRYLADVCISREIRPAVSLVTEDLLIDWGKEGIRNHSPDLGVFAGLSEEPDIAIGTLHLADFGGRCLLLIEIVSPDTRNNDVVEKLREYHQVGVPLYVIVDQKREGGPRRILAYRYTPRRYVEIPLNAQGQVLLEPLGLLVGLREGHVICHDAATGAEVGDYVKLARTIEALEQRCLDQDAAMEEAILRSHAAERDAKTQAEARARAERDAKTQAEARAKAERVAKTQAKARAKAEAELRAREERIRQLEEALRRLPGTSEA